MFCHGGGDYDGSGSDAGGDAGGCRSARSAAWSPPYPWLGISRAFKSGRRVSTLYACAYVSARKSDPDAMMRDGNPRRVSLAALDRLLPAKHCVTTHIYADTRSRGCYFAKLAPKCSFLYRVFALSQLYILIANRTPFALPRIYDCSSRDVLMERVVLRVYLPRKAALGSR